MTEDILELGKAKFPPDQTPALLEDLRAVYDLVVPPPPDPNAPPPPPDAPLPPKPHDEIQANFIETVASLEGVQEHLVLKEKHDSGLVDQDFDAAGYGIHDACDAKERSFSSRTVPLSEKQKKIVEDVKLVRGIFVLENVANEEIFSLGFYQEYNAISIVLDRVKLPAVKAAIERLGWEEEFVRLGECHGLLGKIQGIGLGPPSQSPGAPAGSSLQEETAFARFERARKKLVFAVGLYTNEATEEGRRWRSLILGPLAEHIERFRERRRKLDQKARDRKKAEQDEQALQKEKKERPPWES